MGRGLLIYVLGFGAFMSFLSSGFSHMSTGRGSPGENEGDSHAIVSAERESDYGSSSVSGENGAMTIERSGDGHFYADVQVNGQPIRFLVDTGASGIALTRDDARRAGVATSISMPEVIGEGASGEVRGEIVTLERVSLGSTEANGVGAVVLDTGSQSLLGQSFLSRFASVEIRGDTMILR